MCISLASTERLQGPQGIASPSPPAHPCGVYAMWAGGQLGCALTGRGGGAVRYSSVSGHNPAVTGRQLGADEGSALLTFGPDTSIKRTALVRFNPQSHFCRAPSAAALPCIVSMLQYSAVPLLGWSTVFAVLAEMCAAAGTTPG